MLISTLRARKKGRRGLEQEGLGRSCGVLSSKIHALVDSEGNPIEVRVTQGAAHEMTQAEALLSDRTAQYVLADKGYDSDALRATVQAKGAIPVIPGRSSRKILPEYGKERYKHRNLVERFFNKIKQFRRIATRYEKALVSFMSMIHLSTSVILMRC
ncbi:IS5 family transposase [Candidatus Glomeribacter gigasporarum]|uniref:IS5 family transposase n=1 Tax=Candidatus Glomeribacter gigasporarum TaxID=132144 RepID=UPI0013156547|nr:IS5 family transposase [Candidatus Glomeribacter gigasporarum]